MNFKARKISSAIFSVLQLRRSPHLIHLAHLTQRWLKHPLDDQIAWSCRVHARPKHGQTSETSWHVMVRRVQLCTVWKFNMSLLSGAFGVLHLPCVDTDRPDRTDCSDRPVARASQVFLCAFDKPETWKGFSGSKQSYVYSKFIADILAAAVLCTQYQRLD
jgi:hypothetical protein